MVYEKKIKLKNTYFINPFFAYLLFWSLCLLLYTISPSKLNEKLDSELLFFIIFSISLSFILSHFFKKKFKDKEILIKTHDKNKVLLILLSLLLIVLDFSYCGYIPLISILNGSVGVYLNFGIPSVHVFIATMLTFCGIYNGYLFLLFKDKKDFFLMILSLLYFTLIYSRGLLLFIFICLICLFFVDKKIRFKHIIALVLMATIGVFLFGIFGNIRSGYEWNDSWEIIHWAKIDVDRKNILSSVYWVYEYMICSLRNLNYNIINFKYDYSFNNFISVIIPDFISKRVFNYDISYKLIVPAFTTGTAYLLDYVTFGTLGLYISFLMLIIITSMICFLKFKSSKFQLMSIVIMFFICGLSIFDDMLVYSGYSFTIVFPLLLSSMSQK